MLASFVSKRCFPPLEEQNEIGGRMRELVLILFAVLSFSPLFAQTPGIEPGTPLRVSARGSTVAGDLVRWNADSLVLRLEVGNSAADLRPDRAIAVGEIVRIETLAPRSRGRGAARGALWGAVIGGLIGGVAAAADGCYDDPRAWLCPDSRTEGFLIGSAVIGGVGAGVGTLFGVAFPGERWTPVDSAPR
jgi:hypothetical protein